MRKKIKRWGSSFVIVLTREDLECYNIDEGDFVDINFTKIQDE